MVLNNSLLGQIKWEQMLFLGNPEFGCRLQPVNFAVVAEGFGVRGFRLRRSRTLRRHARRGAGAFWTGVDRCGRRRQRADAAAEAA